MTCDEFQKTVVLYVQLWQNMQVLFLYEPILEALREASKTANSKKTELNSLVNSRIYVPTWS
jgi:hypothetical protein